jgi:tight adherence protein C
MATGPKLLGVDVFMVATFLAAMATFALLVALYAATTVRDPMARRVKALNERREQLKAGIVASTSKRRAKLNSTNAVNDRMRAVLGSLRVLQESQVKQAQRQLMQAGIRSKDMAYAVIFARLVLPIVLGGGVVLAIYAFGPI